MPLKTRIAVMLFLQYFVWGSWMITIANWWFRTQHWSGSQFGAIFSTMGIAAIFIPTLTGIIADRWINAEKLYGFLHLGGAAMLFYIPHIHKPATVFWVMLVNMCFYMPTISFERTISYTAIKNNGMNVIKDYPPIRVLGTVGFIAGMWVISLSHLESSPWMFYVAGIAATTLGFYGFTMPKCPPLGKSTGSFISALGLDAFRLFKNYNMSLFFIFSMLLGASLQLTNAYGDVFLHSFADYAAYQNALAVKYPAIIMSISQMSEVGFIVAVPFFLRRFGIKNVMLMSMVAWVFRFGLLGFGDPAHGLWMIILSCIVYGMAFDFFNISGSLYIETQVEAGFRASAQGLFVLMTNGIGAFLGSFFSGWMISAFFTSRVGTIHWQGFDGVWITFTMYSLIVAVLFAILFKHKHTARDFEHFHH